jgi:hypothetical protein
VRLVLIQIQFLKKELLVAMETIDQLFNANQVNLQLLAITPAILTILCIQKLSQGIMTIAKTFSRGRAVASSSAVQVEIREAIREVERLLILPSELSDKTSHNRRATEDGRLLSLLYRLQLLLVLHSTSFSPVEVKGFQQDLRDLLVPELDQKDSKLDLLDRIQRRYSFLQPSKGLFGVV